MKNKIELINEKERILISMTGKYNGKYTITIANKENVTSIILNNRENAQKELKRIKKQYKLKK